MVSVSSARGLRLVDSLGLVVNRRQVEEALSLLNPESWGRLGRSEWQKLGELVGASERATHQMVVERVRQSLLTSDARDPGSLSSHGSRESKPEIRSKVFDVLDGRHGIRSSLRFSMKRVTKNRIDIVFPEPYARLKVGDYLDAKGYGQIFQGRRKEPLCGFSASVFRVFKEQSARLPKGIDRLASPLEAFEFCLEVVGRAREAGVNLLGGSGRSQLCCWRLIDKAVAQGKLGKSEGIVLKTLITGGLRFEAYRQKSNGDFGPLSKVYDRILISDGSMSVCSARDDTCCLKITCLGIEE